MSYLLVLPHVQVLVEARRVNISPETSGISAARDRNQKTVPHAARQKEVLRTVKLHTESDCEASTEFEGGRMDDVLGNTKVQLLVVV